MYPCMDFFVDIHTRFTFSLTLLNFLNTV